MLVRDEWPIQVWINPEDNDRRKRFTLAHELCHFLLGRTAGLVPQDTIEVFCDAFAGELVAPQVAVDALLTADGGLPLAEEIVLLANRLRVNFAPVILKIPGVPVTRPSFVVLAIPSSERGQLVVHNSAGAGAIGGPPEGRTLARLGSWSTRIDESSNTRMEGTAAVRTRFLLAQDGGARSASKPRSGSIVGTVRWSAFRLTSGRVVLTATFLGVDDLTYSDRRDVTHR
jgi:hypothetical protein